MSMSAQNFNTVARSEAEHVGFLPGIHFCPTWSD